MNKAQSTGRKYKRGMSTLEILMAFAILILCISAVIMVIFGNQSVAVDSETNNEAISKAQRILEDARALSRENFNSVDTDSLPDEDIYHLNQEVVDLTQCKKEITGIVSWNVGGRTLSVDFSTFLSDIAGALALGGDCATDPSGEDWSNPQSFTSTDIVPGGNKGTGIDVIKIDGHKYAFLTSVHSAAASDDFWSFDLETTPPTILDQINTGPGLNAVDVARASNGNYYAYLANNKTTAPYEQLIVVNVTDPTNIIEVLGARRSLPGVAGADPAGRDVYYYNEHLYIGTRLTAGSEFNIYEVGDPENPNFLGQREINHSIRKIFVRDTSAYLATTSNSNELIILDVDNPANIQPLWGGPGSIEPGYDAIDNQNGESIYLLGNNLYLGRARTNSISKPEFYILNLDNLSVLSSTYLTLNPSSAVVRDIDAVSNFIFLGTSDSNAEFQVWKSNDLTSIWSFFNFPQAITGIEFLDDKIYTSVDSNNALHVIYDAP